MRDARMRTARGANWCLAALQDFVTGFGQEMGAMWEALTWLTTDSLRPRPSLATVTEQAIATMGAASDRMNALVGRMGLEEACRRAHARASLSCATPGRPGWPDGNDNEGRLPCNG